MFADALKKVVEGTDLSAPEMAQAMAEIMQGRISPAMLAAFLVALRMKGESVDEVTGAARAMREQAVFIDAGTPNVVDTCGTGGDGADTFNISTAAALAAAGAGVTVAKHGNRNSSSRCGSADVLAALGFNLEVEPVVMEQSIRENGIGFLFAPRMHPAMKNVMPVRRELKLRTIFNILGPLTNPANASGQVIGVFSPVLTELFAAVLKNLGTRRAFVVHGQDGLDEITCTGNTRVTELRDGTVRTYELYPELLVGRTYDAEDLRGGGPETNAAIIRAVLSGERRDGARAAVLLNTAAAIVAGEQADTLEDAVILAEKALDSGAALDKLKRLIEASNS
ncbi:MAG: anthranilate phosphoribosyltransferase [Victivallaceae bacterium]|nr:anthranilate phosphoribosyltransferase [Victivallaceae bacterium]